MAKSKLEQVLEYLINKEEGKARELLHLVIVEKARNIHESLLEQDDATPGGRKLAEADDDDMSFEQYFSEKDLDDVEGAEEDAEAASDDLTDDLFGGDDAEGEEGDEDAEGEEEDPDAAGDSDIEDLKKAIEELQAEFEKLQGGDAGGEEEAPEEEEGDDLGGDDADMGDDADFDLGGDEEEEEEDEGGDGKTVKAMVVKNESQDDDEDDEDFFETLDTLLGDDFHDLSESALDDLEVVKYSNKNELVGASTGAHGEWKVTNSTSPIPQVAKDKRQGGKPVEIKQHQVVGYDRAPAPASKDGTAAKNPKNVKKKHTDGQTRVKKNGDDSALLNKNDGFGSENRKSPTSAVATKSLQK